MTFKPGDAVVKIPCTVIPCGCDGQMIPAGSEGVIAADGKVRLMPNPHSGLGEAYYSVVWVVKGMRRNWGTFGHGMEALDGNFPDISYLEGV